MQVLVQQLAATGKGNVVSPTGMTLFLMTNIFIYLVLQL